MLTSGYLNTYEYIFNDTPSYLQVIVSLLMCQQKKVTILDDFAFITSWHLFLVYSLFSLCIWKKSYGYVIVSRYMEQIFRMLPSYENTIYGVPFELNVR